MPLQLQSSLYRRYYLYKCTADFTAFNGFFLTSYSRIKTSYLIQLSDLKEWKFLFKIIYKNEQTSLGSGPPMDVILLPDVLPLEKQSRKLIGLYEFCASHIDRHPSCCDTLKWPLNLSQAQVKNTKGLLCTMDKNVNIKPSLAMNNV